MKRQFQIVALVLAGLSLAGCDDELYDDVWAQQMLEEEKLKLSGEQVLIGPDQVLCGEKKGLWVTNQMDDGNAIGHLTEQGRALHFVDDIRMGDRRFSNPYTQLRGDFPLKVDKIVKISDESEGVKVVEAELSVIVKHECFEKPLRLLGIDRGDFSQDAAPRIRLRERDGWVGGQILH